MAILRSKHDQFFKRMMKSKKLARNFFKTHLPQKILSLVDLSKIKLEDCSFVDEDLYEHESDVLFSVKRIGMEEDSFLYTLCEHQSTPDPEMPFRLVYYMMQFLKRYVIDHRPSPFPLPFIYPLVIYNGTTSWNTHRSFFSLFGDLLNYTQEIFFNPFFILEVGKMDEADLKRADLCNLMLVSLLRTKNIQDMERKIKLLDQLFQSCGIDAHSGMLRSMLKYFASCIDPKDEGAGLYLVMIRQNFSLKYQEVAMNLLETLKYEGYQKGVAQGIEQGIEQGITQGEQKALKKTAIQMLKEGVDKTFIARITGLAPKEIQKLAALATAD